MVSSPLRIIGELIVDFFVSMMLILSGFVAGTALHDLLTRNWDGFSAVWLVVALVPFLLYVRWRKALNFDGWDVVVYGGGLCLLGIISKQVPNVPLTIEAFIKMSVALYVISRWENFRESRFPRSVRHGHSSDSA